MIKANLDLNFLMYIKKYRKETMHSTYNRIALQKTTYQLNNHNLILHKLQVTCNIQFQELFR